MENLWSWIVWLVIGGIIGWVASILLGKNARMGLVANVIAGCVGAVVGGWIQTFFAFTAGSSIWGWIFAIIGAIIVILVVGLFMPKQSTT